MQLPKAPTAPAEALTPSWLPLCTQTGLFQLVRDYPVAEFKKNVLALAATAKLYGVPTILTTSLEGVWLLVMSLSLSHTVYLAQSLRARHLLLPGPSQLGGSP